MMDPFLMGLGAAGWFGILTSLSPCPLATNIAAISFIGRQVGKTGAVFLSGLLYTVGRAAAYVVLGVLIVSGTLAVPGLAFWLQKYMNMIIGPLLVAMGILLLGWIPLPFIGWKFTDKLQAKAGSWGMFGAFFLGFIFALAFCPVSAGLFFGSLIPLSITQTSRVLYPSVYGIGTALPVLVFAVFIAFAAKSIGVVFNKVSQIEIWARRLTSVALILIGFYYLVVHTFKFGWQ
ncbi:MAG: aromatic aminobenezylarsenical efflux permease ArsG family transporter [Elusimicrobia bacterium]|nr:aromatic aminobenezylarsenical efflux permease ArsG family transporter [Candidatus Obscuribacterium magneticum]